VGGLTPACADRAYAFYRAFVDEVVVASGTKEAEMAKLLENTYRHVNIALMNEMAKFSYELDIDLWDVIRCAATKPFGFQPFHPGPGVGGHCIPIDPNYLSHNVRSRLGYPFRFVELAQEINLSMPAYVMSRIQRMLNESMMSLRGAHVLLLGVTYKADIADHRESPADHLADLLLRSGAIVEYHDPYIREWTVGSNSLACVDDLLVAAKESDITVLLQAHAEYDVEQIATMSGALFDTCGVTSGTVGTRL
jgi:nucleotide sugar dehydrogenase